MAATAAIMMVVFGQIKAPAQEVQEAQHHSAHIMRLAVNRVHLPVVVTVVLVVLPVLIMLTVVLMVATVVTVVAQLALDKEQLPVLLPKLMECYSLPAVIVAYHLPVSEYLTQVTAATVRWADTREALEVRA